MTPILIAGLINIEVTARIEGFPMEYTPVRFPFYGVNSSVSGVGYNLARALTILGDSVHFCSLIGQDRARLMIHDALASDGIASAYILEQLDQTPHSVILYDGEGRRSINVDLKNIQEQSYPLSIFETALQDCQLAMLCNINFARPLLPIVRAQGIPIVTDVHTISDLDDPYNRDFMAGANIVFQSHEKLSVSPETWVKSLFERFGTDIAVVGLGAEGVLLGIRQENVLERIPAVQTRPVVNTIGAGDALLSAFVHYYAKGEHPYTAIRKAQVFASYKIGASGGAADGLLDEAELEAWVARILH